MPSLPKDGTRVVAMTYPSPEYDRKAEEVSGALSTRQSPFSDFPQCWVDDTQVNPATVRPAESAPDGPLDDFDDG